MADNDRPARMSIIDLQDNREVEVMFNPTQFRRKVAASYARKRVLGNSHTNHEYLLTENAEMTFELFFIAESPAQLLQAEITQRFLESLLYAPASGPQSIATFAPPRVHFFWPKTLAMTCRVMEIEWDHQRFNLEGSTVQWTAKLKVEEARVQRLTKEQVFENGPIRTPQGIVNIDEDFDIEFVDDPNGNVDIDGDIDLVYVSPTGEISF